MSANGSKKGDEPGAFESDLMSSIGEVLDVLKARDIRFRRSRPGGYGRQLHELIRKLEPGRAALDSARLITNVLLKLKRLGNDDARYQEQRNGSCPRVRRTLRRDYCGSR